MLIMFSNNDDVPTLEKINLRMGIIQLGKNYVLIQDYKRKFIEEIDNYLEQNPVNTKEGLKDYKLKIKETLKKFVSKGYIKKKVSKKEVKSSVNNFEECRVTRERIVEMLEKYKGEWVEAEYEYNNSLGQQKIREWEGEIKDYNVIGQTNMDYTPYKIEIIFETSGGMVQKIPRHAFFKNEGEIYWANSGPYCHFIINSNN